MIWKTFKTTALSLLLTSAPAFALQNDSKQPTQTEADQGSLDQAKQVTHFSGSVIIKQGTLNLRAASVRVSRSDKGEWFMVADSSPIEFSQTFDNNQGVVNGQTNNAEYSSATGIIKLIGDAKVQRGGGVIQGAVITYNMRTEVYNTIDGGKSSAKASTKSSHVSVVIQPSSTQKK